jgi:hypothetical protein
MERTLTKFGFKKDGIYSWFNEPFHVSIYFDGLTITKVTETNEITIYDGMVPKTEIEEIELIEQYTKLKMINKGVEDLLDSTKSDRIYSNTSLYISNLLISYFKYNGDTEEEICKKLNINKEKLKKYLTGTYDFTLSELARLSVLVGKSIIIK